MKGCQNSAQIMTPQKQKIKYARASKIVKETQKEETY